MANEGSGGEGRRQRRWCRWIGEEEALLIRCAVLGQPATLVAALKAGSFYSSTSPELHDVRFEGDDLVVACSPVETILITSRGAKSQRVIQPGISEVRFPIVDWRELGFLRVTVRDDAGGRAWTNPVWF